MIAALKAVSSRVVALATIAALAGCATASSIERHAPPSVALSNAATVPGFSGIRVWGDYVPKDSIVEFRRMFPGVPRLGQSTTIVDGRPLVRTLALSGGGPDGAFGAGLLAGWTDSGTRPQFQLVTGISAGALIAPFAFLGSSYDEPLRQIWTQYETSELITAQLLPGLFGGPALADTAPLARLIATYVDHSFLEQIAAEYAKGRILLVGTTNLDAQRPVVWNMGEIARKGDAAAIDLFRKVLLASAAIPGAFPPVQIKVEVDGQIYDELHVDGGTTREVFIGGLQVPIRDLDRLYDIPPKREYYIIKNGRISGDYGEVQPKTLAIASRAVSTLLLRQNAADIYRIYRSTQDAQADFNLIAVPESFTAKPKQAFDPTYQSALFDTGYNMARSGVSWMKVPPELLPTTTPAPTSLVVASGPVKSAIRPAKAAPARGFFDGLSGP